MTRVITTQTLLKHACDIRQNRNFKRLSEDRVNDRLLVFDCCLVDTIDRNYAITFSKNLKDTREHILEETSARITKLNRRIAKVSQLDGEFI